jgi:hypothetical protein
MKLYFSDEITVRAEDSYIEDRREKIEGKTLLRFSTRSSDVHNHLGNCYINPEINLPKIQQHPSFYLLVYFLSLLILSRDELMNNFFIEVLLNQLQRPLSSYLRKSQRSSWVLLRFDETDWNLTALFTSLLIRPLAVLSAREALFGFN